MLLDSCVTYVPGCSTPSRSENPFVLAGSVATYGTTPAFTCGQSNQRARVVKRRQWNDLSIIQLVLGQPVRQFAGSLPQAVAGGSEHRVDSFRVEQRLFGAAPHGETC